MDDMFTDAFERLLGQIAAPAAVRAVDGGASAEAMWDGIEESGFLDALVPEAAVGAGLTLAQAFPLLFAAGRHVLPVPFGQTMLARAWLDAAGVASPPGPIAIAGFGVKRQDGAWLARDVSFGRTSRWVLASTDTDCVLLPVASAQAQHGDVPGGLGATLCWPARPGEAMDVAMPSAEGAAGLAELDAVCHAVLIAGAADRVLAMTLDYAGQRTQFGKHIGRFQAVQNQISIMAEHTWAARMAAQLACSSAGWLPRPLGAALGKSRCAEAAPVIADIGHAVHGAMGITNEFDLQLYTRRLREWRLAAGSESYWAGVVGEALLRDTRHGALSFIRSQFSMEQA